MFISKKVIDEFGKRKENRDMVAEILAKKLQEMANTVEKEKDQEKKRNSEPIQNSSLATAQKETDR